MMKVSTALRKARKLLEPDRAWRRGYWGYSRKLNREVEYYDKDADAFCALGAIGKAADLKCSDDLVDAHPAAKVLAKVVYGDHNRSRHIPTWNDDDNRKKKQILAKFDKAIELAECLEKEDPDLLKSL